MGKIKIVLVVLLIVLSLAGSSRDIRHADLFKDSPAFSKSKKRSAVFYRTIEDDLVGKGLFRATLTFATGYMPANKLNNLYLTGNIEYYTNRQISLRGDAMYFFNSMNGDKTLKKNHSIYSGAAYHFANGAFDPFIGLQAGLAYTQCGIIQADGTERATAFNPLISPIAGFNYYAPKWFHLFINMRYNIGKHLANDAIIPMNELNFSFGLGFNIK